MATLSGFNNPEGRMNVAETLKRPLQSHMRSILK